VEFLRSGQALGAVTLRVRTPGSLWREVQQSTNGVELTSRFRLHDDALLWEIRAKNTRTETLEVGDLALPLPMNTDYVWDHEATLERRVFRHTIRIDVFIAQRDGGKPISPWHAKPENGGLTPDQYVETQRKTFKYWRERGFEVTGEGIFWAHPPGEGFTGL
jgi:hypothetical protein